ncbi:uncharacterized protein SCDLUD_004924 [Saccharomycodes ludwigii]|uniref:uncharacterized protein n=1 Tax=Saccharomycodes ludwigii TaxID=36035 RepID=UPI001E82DE08|nr:hypothetical protein SCDLUD_004924 [Saccharomycodes ludwigii]KAH3899480.1 hypothetical protein SCDLUD_004924 [Saccharomycodes ludwigii]
MNQFRTALIKRYYATGTDPVTHDMGNKQTIHLTSRGPASSLKVLGNITLVCVGLFVGFQVYRHKLIEKTQKEWEDEFNKLKIQSTGEKELDQGILNPKVKNIYQQH